jgi:hypothetical protein
MMNKQLINSILRKLQKEAAVPPMDPAAMGGMPMDPAMMGGMPPGGAPMPPPPMDPAMAGGGAPVDPATGLPIDPATGMPIDPATGQPIDPAMLQAMMGGMDPAAMGGMPMDPAMAGGMPPAGPEGAPVMLAMEDLQAILQEATAGQQAKLDKIEQQLAAISDMLQINSGNEGAPEPVDVAEAGFTEEALDPNLQKQARWEENHQKWLKKNKETREQSGILEALRRFNGKR